MDIKFDDEELELVQNIHSEHEDEDFDVDFDDDDDSESSVLNNEEYINNNSFEVIDTIMDNDTEKYKEVDSNNYNYEGYSEEYTTEKTEFRQEYNGYGYSNSEENLYNTEEIEFEDTNSQDSDIDEIQFDEDEPVYNNEVIVEEQTQYNETAEVEQNNYVDDRIKEESVFSDNDSGNSINDNNTQEVKLSKKELKRQKKLEKAEAKKNKASSKNKNNTINIEDQQVNEQGNGIDNTSKIKKQKNEEAEVQDLVLYFLVDKNVPGMINYYRDHGINISKIFTNIGDIRNALLMQVELCRVVIIDSGTGTFSLVSSRNMLVDLMGISDESNRISMFYTDQIIKDDVGLSREVEDKDIEWAKYRSNVDILATLLIKKKYENYVMDMGDNEDTVIAHDDLLKIKGLKINMNEKITLGEPLFKAEDVIVNIGLSERYSQLPAYKVTY